MGKDMKVRRRLQRLGRAGGMVGARFRASVSELNRRWFRFLWRTWFVWGRGTNGACWVGKLDGAFVFTWQAPSPAGPSSSRPIRTGRARLGSWRRRTTSRPSRTGPCPTKRSTSTTWPTAAARRCPRWPPSSWRCTTSGRTIWAAPVRSPARPSPRPAESSAWSAPVPAADGPASTAKCAVPRHQVSLLDGFLDRLSLRFMLKIEDSDYKISNFYRRFFWRTVTFHWAYAQFS